MSLVWLLVNLIIWCVSVSFCRGTCVSLVRSLDSEIIFARSVKLVTIIVALCGKAWV